MILESEVLIKINSQTVNYWLEKGYSITGHVDSEGIKRVFKRGSSLLVKVLDLPKHSNATITAKCLTCGLVRKTKFTSYSETCWACNFAKQKGQSHPKFLRGILTTGKDRSFDLYIRRAYGLTIEEYYILFESQDYKCAICKRHQATDGRKFAVDHIKDTKIIRGILCQPCNTAIGLLQHDPTVLEYAKTYLLERTR